MFAQEFAKRPNELLEKEIGANLEDFSIYMFPVNDESVKLISESLEYTSELPTLEELQHILQLLKPLKHQNLLPHLYSLVKVANALKAHTITKILESIPPVTLEIIYWQEIESSFAYLILHILQVFPLHLYRLAKNLLALNGTMATKIFRLSEPRDSRPFSYLHEVQRSISRPLSAHEIIRKGISQKRSKLEHLNVIYSMQLGLLSRYENALDGKQIKNLFKSQIGTIENAKIYQGISSRIIAHLSKYIKVLEFANDPLALEIESPAANEIDATFQDDTLSLEGIHDRL